MANYNRRLSFEVPCTQAEYAALQQVLDARLDSGELEAKILDPDFASVERAENKDGVLAVVVPGSTLEALDFDCLFNPEKTNEDVLWIYAQEQVNIDHVVYAVQQLFRIQGQPDDHEIIFSYADTAERPYVDVFGGGAVRVTPASCQELHTSELADLLRLDGQFAAVGPSK